MKALGHFDDVAVFVLSSGEGIMREGVIVGLSCLFGFT